jgi:hypothetical protein
MKKVLFAAVAVFAFGAANAQEIKFGAKIGANLSTSSVSMPSVEGTSFTIPDNKMLFGLHVGGFAEIGISEKFAFQPELLFSMEGSKFESSSVEDFGGIVYSETSESTIKLNYINVPLLVKFYATEKFFINAGPQIGFLMSAKQDSDYTLTFDGGQTESESTSNVDVKDQYKSINFSAAAGAGYYFTENIFAEVRYNVGVSNILESQTVDTGFGSFTFEPEAKINNLQITLGYRF